MQVKCTGSGVAYCAKADSGGMPPCVPRSNLFLWWPGLGLFCGTLEDIFLVIKEGDV